MTDGTTAQPATAAAAGVGGVADERGILNWDQLSQQLSVTQGLRPVGLRNVFIGSDVLGGLAATVSRLRAGRDADIILLRDAVAKQIGSKDLHAIVMRDLGAVGPVREVVLNGPHNIVHADEATVATALAAASDAAVIVTVGSGTLADIGKVVAATHQVPHVIVQTAASVNGFADDQSVLLRSGVKRTVQSCWPDALIVDADVLAGAPLELNRSGVGDLLSMFTAPADWRLASEIGLPAGYQQAPIDMVRPHGETLLALAPRLADSDSAALAFLAELLTLSGIGMGVSGRTSPSSGFEHLISHMLDMHCAAKGQIPDSHGAQVGVGSIVAAATWARVRVALRGGVTDIRLPDPDQSRRRIDEAFLRLDESGRTAAECWSGYATKIRQLEDALPQLQSVLRNWQKLDEIFDALLIDATRLADALETLGAPVRLDQLKPRYPDEVGRWSIANAHLMRDRFTIADLADLLGLGGLDGADAVLSDIAVLGRRS